GGAAGANHRRARGPRGGHSERRKRRPSGGLRMDQNADETDSVQIRRTGALVLVLVTAVVSVFSPSTGAQQDESAFPRNRTPLTILQLNDVYSTVPIEGAGGLARVATLKKNLLAGGRTPLLVLAGDFLSPSVASSVFKGEQMIAELNAAGLDIATLG